MWLASRSARSPAGCRPAYDNRIPMHPPPSDAAAPQDHPQPRSPRDLFISFTWLALQGFGGVLAIVQREMVEKKKWLTPEQFLEDWAVAQVMPGPNVINLGLMIGDRYFGLRGALAAVAGMLTIPLVVILALAVLYAHYAGNPQVAAALRGMGAVSGGLIAATGIKLVPQLRKHPLGFTTCLAFMALVFAAIAVFKIPLGWVLLVLGGVACIWTWRKIAP
jgi:chromate transporter